MERSLVANAADEKQIKEAETKEKSIRERELDDVAFILSSTRGRRFFWRMLTECGVFRSSWDPSARIHFNEGKRQIGLVLLADLNEAEPSAYEIMMRESQLENELRKTKKGKGND